MAYSKKENFTNFGEGKGIPYYGSKPRTFDSDLALITNCPGYHCLRMVKAQVEEGGKLYDTTIWVGLKEAAKDLDDKIITHADIVKFVALGCPPYIRDLIEVGKVDKSDIIEKIIDFEINGGSDLEFETD